MCLFLSPKIRGRTQLVERELFLDRFMGLQKPGWFGKLHPLSWGLRSRKHKDAVRHQYTCWLWTHLLSLGVRRQEHFNFDFSICYKILSCPTFFLFSFIAWIPRIYSNLKMTLKKIIKMTLSIALIPSSNKDTDSFFNVCIFLPVNFFCLLKLAYT